MAAVLNVVSVSRGDCEDVAAYCCEWKCQCATGCKGQEHGLEGGDLHFDGVGPITRLWTL